MTAASGNPGDRPQNEGAGEGGYEAPPIEQTPAYWTPAYPSYPTTPDPAYGSPPDPAYGVPPGPAYGSPPDPAYGVPPGPAWATPPAPPAPGTPPGPYSMPPGHPPPGLPWAGYPPGPTGYPGFPGYPGYPPPAQPGTNPLAVTALVCSVLGLAPFCGFLFSIAGIVAGAVGIGQIKRTGQSGNGLAVAGIVIGVITLLIWMVGLTVFWG